MTDIGLLQNYCHTHPQIERYKHDSALKAQQKLDHNRKLGRERQYMVSSSGSAMYM
jgi:hypothetical protein